MLIGIDASRANLDKKTGVEWYAYYLIQELKKITSPIGDNFILYSPCQLKENLGDLPINWRTKILKWPFKYLWTQLRLSWETLFKAPDLLFVPSHAIPVFSRAKNVITLHDLGFERFPRAYGWRQRFYLKFVFRWAGKFAETIIVPSKYTKQELINLYKINPDKIKVIYLGYSADNFRLINDSDKTKLILDKHQIDSPFILYVGRLETKKNILFLIESFEKINAIHPELKLVLVGSPGYGYEKIDPLLKKLSDKIINIDYLDQSETPYLYSAATCFVYPSLYEGFGLPLLEAMACGCPVIASRSASIPEVGGEAVMYFNPLDQQSLIDGLKKIIYDDQLRDKLIKAGAERVKYFSWSKCAQETMKVLREI